MSQSMSICFLWICLTITIRGNTTLSWSISTTTLPRSDGQMAVAYSTTTGLLWLIGGDAHRKQLVSFNPSSLDTTSPFINDTMLALSDNHTFSGQGYTQIDDILYMIDQSGNTLSIFDLSSQEFISNYNNITIPQSVRHHACLAHIDHYLIITGGTDDDSNILFKVQIYDLSYKSWILNANNMTTPRAAHACIVNPDNKYLYVFGGDNILSDNDIATDMLGTISKLYVGDIENIQQYQWIDLKDTLSAAVQGLRAVIYNDNIYIIGGQYHESGSSQYSSYVDRLSSDDRVISDSNLLQSTSYASCIIANNRLFVIGGYVDGYYLDTIQYAILDSSSSSMDIIPIILGCIVLVFCCVMVLVVNFSKQRKEIQEKEANSPNKEESVTESEISDLEQAGEPSLGAQANSADTARARKHIEMQYSKVVSHGVHANIVELQPGLNNMEARRASEDDMTVDEPGNDRQLEGKASDDGIVGEEGVEGKVERL